MHFCAEYGIAPHDNRMLDICHVVNKSQGGLGVEQNGLLADITIIYNSSQNKEFRDFAENYLITFLSRVEQKNVTYNKWGF